MLALTLGASVNQMNALWNALAGAMKAITFVENLVGFLMQLARSGVLLQETVMMGLHMKTCRIPFPPRLIYSKAGDARTMKEIELWVQSLPWEGWIKLP